MNGLLLNSKKTQCIFIGSRALISKIPSDTSVKVDDVSILPSLSLKNLGVFFDRHMSFDVHITEMSRKVSGILMYINRIQNSLSKEARLIAVQTLALSHLNYAITVWGTANITQLKRVQKLQNFAARIAIGGVSKFDHATPLLQKLQWLPMEKKCVLEQCALTFKVIKKQLPNWFLSFPEVRDLRSNDTHTRQCNFLHVPRTQTDTGARSIVVRGPALWNKLPDKLKHSKSLGVLKGALKCFLLNNELAVEC